MASKGFDKLNDRMLGKLLATNPDSATIFGKHEPYDRHLPHGGFERFGATLELLDEWNTLACEIATNDDLSRDQEVSLKVLQYTLNTYRFAIDDYPLWRMRPDALENPGTAMMMMLVREYAPLDARLKSMAERIGELPRYLEQFRKRFTGARTVTMWTETALQSCKDFPSFLCGVRKLASAKAKNEVRDKMISATVQAEEELRGHETWLRKMLDSSTDKYAMGKEKFAKLLRIRGIKFSPDELVDLAMRYLKDFKNERAEMASRISAGRSVDDARKIVESDSPRDVNEVVAKTRVVIERAKDFVTKENLATIPPGSRVQVMEAPGFLGQSISSASTYLAAVFEKSQDTIFLIGRVEDEVQLRSTWNNPSIDSTAVHEAYPGHHHQGVMSNKKPWMHQLPHIIYAPETLAPPYESQEGWATYCEDMMREKGFLGSHSHAFTMLDYSIGTCWRLLSEVRLSCNEATIEEMIERTVEESGFTRSFAEADIKGFSRIPGYGICYLLGRHLITELKSDLKREQGPRFSEKSFHNLVAENGNLPFYILEQEVRAGLGSMKVS